MTPKKPSAFSSRKLLNMTNGAARWLGIYLATPQLFKGTVDVFNASILCASHLADVARLPATVAADRDDVGGLFSEWADRMHAPFEVTDAQSATVKTGLSVLSAAGALVVHRYTGELLLLFGLDKEPFTA